MSTLLEHFSALDCTFPWSSALFESSLNFWLQLQLILNNRLHLFSYLCELLQGLNF